MAAYRLAIYRAADAAFPVAPELSRLKGETETTWRRRLGARWQAVLAHRSRHRWHPHQLRHTFADQVRRQFGLEYAQRALGHRHAKVTEVYAQVAFEKAAAVATALG